MGGTNERRVRLPKESGPDRRASTRFPLTLEVRYAVWDGTRAPRRAGSGRTVDVSSGGIRFSADTLLPIGVRLDVAMNWPVLLDAGVQLQLVASGVVIRALEGETVLQINRYEFRTRAV